VHPELHLKYYQKNPKMHLAHCCPRDSYPTQCQQVRSGLSLDLLIPNKPLRCPSPARSCSCMNSGDKSGSRQSGVFPYHEFIIKAVQLAQDV